MTERITKDDPDVVSVIDAAIENISFFLFAILSDCYPELVNAEYEAMFKDEFRTDVIAFVKNYRQEVFLSLSGKSAARAYASKRFFERLSIALENCKTADDRTKGKEIKGRPDSGLPAQ